MSNYPKGSEWRRWDLHLHTPSSVDYKNKGTTSNQDIINTLVQKNVDIAVITDHNIIDKERISELQELGKKKNITIMPGIELRGEYGKEPINYIGIFPENSDLDYLSNDLIAKLDLNKKRQNGRSEDELYCELKHGAELIRDHGGLVSIHAGKKSNSIECIPNSLPSSMAQKQDIAERVDIFELGSKDDQEDYEKIVFKKLKKRYPLVVTSDNHKIKEYSFKKDQYCWIKADPTFEGLKQIIDEPADRVYIGEYPPTAKENYRVIESVLIGDKRFPNEIFINSDLVSIAGSRSSGKSTLLTHIAHSIDAHQVYEKIDNFKPWVTDFKVRWRDGHVSPDDDTEGDSREIIFIPQGYINNLADSEESSEAEILRFAEAAIASGGDDFETKRKELDRQARELSQSINIKITTLFNAMNDRVTLHKQAIQAGDKKGIEGEIKKLTKIIEKSSVKISPEELAKYKRTTDQLAELETEQHQIEKDVITLGRLAKDFDINESNLPTNLHIEHPKVEQVIERQLAQSLEKLNKDVRESAVGQLKWITARKKEIADSVKVVKLETKDIREKLSKNEDIKKQMALLQKQKDALGTIQKLEKDIKELDRQIVSTEDSLIKIWQERVDLRHDFSKGVSKNIDGVQFEAHVVSDNNKLQSFANAYINQRENAEAREVIDPNIVTVEGGFNPVLLVTHDNIEKSLRAIVSGKLHLKSGVEKENAVKQLFADYEYVGYKITFENDEYAQMTPGKKALVVLKLILESSKGRCPVLIDQPEDDLDSRSIFDAVVPFMREKKKERQIILVSHNANMVVATDSEQVIVANRHGNNSPNVSKLGFDYLTGSIEDTKVRDEACKTVLESQGVREHVCDILEGSERAFALRKSRYNIK